ASRSARDSPWSGSSSSTTSGAGVPTSPKTSPSVRCPPVGSCGTSTQLAPSVRVRRAPEKCQPPSSLKSSVARPASARSSVLLPVPEGPIRTVTRPRSTRQVVCSRKTRPKASRLAASSAMGAGSMAVILSSSCCLEQPVAGGLADAGTDDGLAQGFSDAQTRHLPPAEVALQAPGDMADVGLYHLRVIGVFFDSAEQSM